MIFFGRVQGVGFRYTAQSMAENSGIVGWVRNLPDGTVEMVAEGDSAVMDDLVSRIRSYFGGHIRDCLIQKLPATSEYSSFDIIS
jgi:acylphosphatase